MIFLWVVGILVVKEGVSVHSCSFEGFLILSPGCWHGRYLYIVLLDYFYNYYYTTKTTTGTTATCIPILLKLILQILPLVQG